MQRQAVEAMRSEAVVSERRACGLVRWETPRLCRGGSRSLTIPAVSFRSHTRFASRFEVRSCWF